MGHLTEDDVVDSQGEDKLQKEAARRQMDPWQIAREEEKNFMDDLALMEIPPAHVYPRATEHINEMIEMVETLLEKGLAYEVDGNVYFSISDWPESGVLSGNRWDNLEVGASGRVDDRPKTSWTSPFGSKRKTPRTVGFALGPRIPGMAHRSAQRWLTSIWVIPSTSIPVVKTISSASRVNHKVRLHSKTRAALGTWDGWKSVAVKW